MLKQRVKKLEEIAKDNGVNVTIRTLGNDIYAHINGISFKVRGYATFNAKCKELKNYTPPKPIDLTSRLTKIEENTFYYNS